MKKKYGEKDKTKKQKKEKGDFDAAADNNNKIFLSQINSYLK